MSSRALFQQLKMKLNISYPGNGTQKTIDIENELALRPFYEKRISHEVPGDSLGDEFKGYVFRISGGNDKQGFPMKQGVLSNDRVYLLLQKGHSCYRQRRKGERKRKAVRGCIVDANLAVLSLVIVKKGEKDIPGITDATKPRRLGPKRAGKIRALFALDKADDVRKYVIKRKRAIVARKRNSATRARDLAAAYQKLLAQKAKVKAEASAVEKERKRTNSTRTSESKK